MPLDQIDVDKLEEQEGAEAEMTFLEHLEELRWHIIRSLIAIVGLGIIFYIFHKWIYDHIIFAPTKNSFPTYQFFCDNVSVLCSLPDVKFQATKFAEQFIISIKSSFILGFVVSFPYVFFEFWRFVSPGLYDTERRLTRGIVLTCSLLFFLGILFGYFVITPFAYNMLMNYQVADQVENIPTISSYLGYLVMFNLPAGLIFELPVVIYIFSKLGLVTPEGMRSYRKHSFVGILLLAAILTPPDVITQFLIGIPLYILYEISILISARVQKNAAAKELSQS